MYFDEMIWAAVQAFTGDLQPTVGSQVRGSPLPLDWMGREQPNYVPDGGPVERTPVSAVPPSRWMKTYTNGNIPYKALTQVPQLGQGNLPGSYLRPDVAEAYLAMWRAAKADGVTLTGSGYRTYYGQVVAANSNNGLPHATPGTSNHGWGIAIDMTPNEWLLRHADEYGFYRPLDNDPPHWEYNGKTGIDTPKNAPDRRRGTVPPHPTDAAFAIEMLAGVESPTYFANAMFSTQQDEAARRVGGVPRYVERGDAGPQGNTKRQLWQGFMDAGRPDLAKMVYTKDFDTWVKAESGWNPSVVSKYYEGHGRNAGLFQFALLDRGWVWSDVDQQNWSYGATAYEQAKLLVKYFHLTPAEIRNYAQQVRSGTYAGWG